jgi:hypothetical protein
MPLTQDDLLQVAIVSAIVTVLAVMLYHHACGPKKPRYYQSCEEFDNNAPRPIVCSAPGATCRNVTSKSDGSYSVQNGTCKLVSGRLVCS